jgi:hypothetical protein
VLWFVYASEKGQPQRGLKMVKYKAKFPRVEAQVITVEAADFEEAVVKVLAERKKYVTTTRLDMEVDEGDPSSLVSPGKTADKK